jgi:hypothetical protein
MIPLVDPSEAQAAVFSPRTEAICGELCVPPRVTDVAVAGVDLQGSGIPAVVREFEKKQA